MVACSFNLTLVKKRDHKGVSAAKYEPSYQINDKQVQETYCYCKRAIESTMIGCDDKNVGLHNQVRDQVVPYRMSGHEA